LAVERKPKPDATRIGETQMYYKIHYQGWKEKWDEWVDNTRIMKYTPENKELRDRLRKEFNEQQRLKKNKSK
jgi:mortality factor 4-like protein 1